MKKLIILIIMLALPVGLMAQDFMVDKGSIGIGGTLGFSSMSGDLYENFDGDGATMIMIAPELMFFFMPNLGIGAQFSYESFSQGDLSGSELGIGPRIAYFFGNASSSMFPFISATYNMTSLGGDAPADKGSSIIIAGGAMFAAARNIGISAAVFYSMDSYTPEDVDAIKGTMIGVLVAINAFIW